MLRFCGRWKKGGEGGRGVSRCGRRRYGVERREEW
jgi:hypothetical protein